MGYERSSSFSVIRRGEGGMGISDTIITSQLAQLEVGFSQTACIRLAILGIVVSSRTRGRRAGGFHSLAMVDHCDDMVVMSARHLVSIVFRRHGEKSVDARYGLKSFERSPTGGDQSEDQHRIHPSEESSASSSSLQY